MSGVCVITVDQEQLSDVCIMITVDQEQLSDVCIMITVDQEQLSDVCTVTVDQELVSDVCIMITVDQELALWRCLMTLLVDDEADVRDAAAEVVDALDTDEERHSAHDHTRSVDSAVCQCCRDGTGSVSVLYRLCLCCTGLCLLCRLVSVLCRCCVSVADGRLYTVGTSDDTRVLLTASDSERPEEVSLERCPGTGDCDGTHLGLCVEY